MATARDADARLLRAFRGAEAAWLSLEVLSAQTGLGGTQVLGEIAGLRAAGYTLAEESGQRFRLAASPPRLIAADLVAGLPAEDVVVGREIAVFAETGSTNDLAARAGENDSREGLVIFAEIQRAGRGRLGRAWESAPFQGLWFSVLLRPNAPVERWPELTFCAALAVAEAAGAVTGREAAIKWPNDVLLLGRKVCGILLECHHRQPPGYVVVGIGLNVLQTAEDFAPELRERAGSLQALAAPVRKVSRRLAALAVLTRLEHHYRGWPENLSAIRQACAARGCVEL